MGLLSLFRRRKTIANVRVGKAHVSPDLPSHVPRVKQGNTKHPIMGYGRGIREHKSGARGTARRSTGIRPLRHNAIVPFLMPNLSPP